MIWNSFAEFVDMHGYWPYVWGSFGFSFFLFLIEINSLRQKRRRLTQSEPS